MIRGTSSTLRIRLPKHTPYPIGFALATVLAMEIAPLQAADNISSRDLALARDYVFAACVIDRYSGSSLASEAEAWASGLVEQGHLAAAAYPALAQWARTAAEPGTTRNGVAMRLQSCFDFTNAQGFSDHMKDVLRHASP
jgi:hypothetical protein